jgi:hypothetical protein
MKLPLHLLLLVIIGSSYAQSKLPACQDSISSRWTNCFGTYTFNSGAKYVGGWKEGEMHGQGTWSFANGDKYFGEYKDSQRNGQGTFTFANGDKYVGMWKDGRHHGQGTFTFANGDKYVGEWNDGKRQGRGTNTFADGAKYVGEYRNDKRHGQGILYAANGSIFKQGVWAENILIRSQSVQQATIPNTESENLKNDPQHPKRRQAPN